MQFVKVHTAFNKLETHRYFLSGPFLWCYYGKTVIISLPIIGLQIIDLPIKVLPIQALPIIYYGIHSRPVHTIALRTTTKCFYLEARKDGGGADAECEHVGDRGDGDCDSGVLVGSRQNKISTPVKV